MNKYVHTVASVGFLFTLNYDARNHELKIVLNYHNSSNDKPSMYCIQLHNNFAAYFGVFFYICSEIYNDAV